MNTVFTEQLTKGDFKGENSIGKVQTIYLCNIKLCKNYKICTKHHVNNDVINKHYIPLGHRH